MTRTLTTAILSTTMLLGLTACSKRPFIIEKGCVKDDFSITINDKNAVLKPDKFFNLEDYKLVANPKRFPPTLKTLHDFKNKFVNYKVTITRPGNDKPYYGRLAFFAVPDKMKNLAVCSFYKISIDGAYFQQAEDGRTAYLYEYYTIDGKRGGNFPTWIIWLSDIPI